MYAKEYNFWTKPASIYKNMFTLSALRKACQEFKKIIKFLVPQRNLTSLYFLFILLAVIIAIGNNFTIFGSKATQNLQQLTDTPVQVQIDHN